MDRGLIIALLALEKDFITRQQFIASFQAWLVNRQLKLEEILIQRAFVTKNQLERLSSSSVEWQVALKENQAVENVVFEMLTLSQNNPVVLQMVRMIGDALTDSPSSDKPQSTYDPHATIEIQIPDPYATLSMREFDEKE